VADALTVYNLALSALGTESHVESPSEVSREAEVCNLHYEVARDLVFSAAPWAPLTGYSRLATVAIRDDTEDWIGTDPPPGWLYAFGLPSDALRPRYLASYGRFLPSLVGNTPVLAANEEAPILVYTRRIETVDLWGIDLLTAVSQTLAAMIAKAITGKDSDLQNMYQLAESRVLQARANFANTMTTQVLETMPDWITARGASITPPEQRYIYPNANFTIAGANNLG
jgi:hypothetical protein